MSGQEPIIEAKGLTRVFTDFWRRPKVVALKDVSFEVLPGEVFGLLGPNGAGKTTAIKIMLGLLRPTQGTLRIFGKSPRDVKTKARIGYLPEESFLYDYLTSEETLEFYGRLFDLSHRERKERIRQLLDMVGLKHARRRTVAEYSKGMARRLGLAQALINDPDLVVLDEPTSGLDPIGRRQVKDLILALAQRGKTVFLSSHLLADVEDVCDRIAILYGGSIWVQGRVKELLEERESCRITLPNPSADGLKRVLAKLREELGIEPFVDHPRRNLEQFFLEIIKEARESAKDSRGTTEAGGVADYLSTKSE